MAKYLIHSFRWGSNFHGHKYYCILNLNIQNNVWLVLVTRMLQKTCLKVKYNIISLFKLIKAIYTTIYLKV
jgi:hypothetical protein